jgi:hypothetical protein
MFGKHLEARQDPFLPQSFQLKHKIILSCHETLIAPAVVKVLLNDPK